MEKFVGLWVLYLGTALCAFSQVDTSYIYNANMPYGTLDLRLAKSSTRYYYLQEGITFSYRESSPGVRTNTYIGMTTWNTSPYEQGNLREINGSSDNFVMNYRLLKPKNYNASYDPGYPIIIMFHGAGESANCWIDERCYWGSASYNPVTNSPPAPTDQYHKLLNNDRQLLHGGAQHLSAVNLAGSRLPDDPGLPARAFPGFVLFPQSLNGWGPTNTVEDAIRILRLIIKKYNIDENRVYVHGLSNGGIGVYQAIKRAPWLFAAALPMSAISDAGITTQGMVNEVSKIPLWIFQGGLDTNPTPQRTYNFVRQFRDAGGDVRYSYYGHLGHGTWNTAYYEPDFFTWMLGKRKNNPVVRYGSPVLCSTTGAGVEFTFASGFLAYQWERDGQIIPGATGAVFTANSPGTYRGRFSRVASPSEEDWEPWSEAFVVSELYPEKPDIHAIGTAHLRGPALPSTEQNNTVKLWSVDSAELYMWYKDGVPVNFSGTSIDDTLRLAPLMYGSTSGNGAYTLVVESFNCPSPASDPLSIYFSNSSPLNITIAADAMNFEGVPTASSIFLTWNDVSGVETGYEIWRRKAGTADFQFVAKTGEDAVSFEDTNLDPSSTYEYKVRAVNNSGHSNYVPSDDLAVNYTFTTLGDHRTPPPPQNLKAVSNTLSTITLSWTAAQDENNIKEYHIYYNNEFVSTNKDTTAFTITGLPHNTAYTIHVKAVDFGDHVSQPSNQIIATTYLTGLVYEHSTGRWESLDDSAMVASFATPEFTGTVPNFTLQPRTQDDYFNFRFTGYINIETEGTYYFNITSDDGSRLFLDGTVIADNDGIHGTRTVLSEAVYLTTGPHPIEVQYFDDVGGHNLTVRYKGPGVGDGVTFVPIPDAALRSGTYIPPAPPTAPTGLVASASGMQRVDLSWSFEDDAETDYEVYRSTTSGGPFQIVVRAEGTSAIDSIGLLPGTAYFYKVKTVNNNGSSGLSAQATTTTSPDAEAPTVPQELTVITNALTSVAFSWQPSTDNVGVTQYEIYAGGVLVGTSTMQAFTVEGLSPNSAYVLMVKAVDASGNKSAASAQLAVVTNPSAVFYSLATGNLNELSTWRRNADGTGDAPQNFSDNGQFFTITNRTTTTLGGPWTIGGSSSRLIIPDGVTLTADHALSAHVEMEGTAVLNLHNSTAPDLVKLSPASTVNFNAYPSIPANTYGNVVLSGTIPKTFDSDTVTVRGNLTVHEGIALKGSPQNSTHLRLFGTLTLQGTRPQTAADNAIDLIFAGAAQSVVTGGDVYFYQVNASANETIHVTNPSGAPIRIHVGSLNGGGLMLANGSVLNINDHDLILTGAAVVNAGQQTGNISATGGDIVISSTSARNSNLYFTAANHLVNYFEVNLSGTGIASIHSPLDISGGIKVKDGTLAAGGNMTLLSDEERTAVIYEIENDGKITGAVTVQQQLPASGNVFHYLSSPINGVTVAEWQQSFPVSGQFSGASNSGPPSLFIYREDTGWAPYPPSGGSNTAPIERGVGYAAFLNNPSLPVTMSADGNPYQGSIPFTLAGGDEGLTNDGWNFIGNPYASPVTWNGRAGAWTRSGVNNVIAIRKNSTVDGHTRSQVEYFDVSIGGGIIPAGQAFWVRTYTGSPALSIQENAKVDPEATEDITPVAKHLVVTLKQGNVSDPAYIVFTPDGTDGFDPQYDGRKLRNYGMFNFATITADTALLAVNHVNDAFCSKTIDLNLSDVSPGAYAFSFGNLQSLADIGSIILTDHFTGASADITGADFAFSVTDDPASYGGARFSLTFSKNRVDVITPKVTTMDICPPGPGHLVVSDSQQDAVYEVINESGELISESVTGTGGTIEVRLLADVLAPGANKLRVTVGFTGCDRVTFPGELTVNYISELSVTTSGDVSVCEGADVVLEASGAPAGGFYKWFDGKGVLIAGATGSTLQVSDITAETVYFVASAHPGGCESGLAEIHVYADTLDTPVILIKGDSLYTDVVGFYQWRKDGEDIPGATLHYYIPSEDGSYTVIASNGGCHKESEPYKVGAPVTGIGDPQNSEFVLSIYPVPSSGHSINVLLQTPRTEPVHIEIIDALGRIHFSKVVEATSLRSGISLVPNAPLYNGIYFVRATQGEIRERKKIIVKD